MVGELSLEHDIDGRKVSVLYFNGHVLAPEVNTAPGPKSHSVVGAAALVVFRAG
jgi:hypothetical protein